MLAKSLFFTILFTTALSGIAATPNRALTIEIMSDGRGIDQKSITNARRISGDALSIGTIDNFIVNVPKIGGPIFREGGISACAEKGFNATQSQFNAYLKKLKNIKPRVGTFVNIKFTETCFPKASPPAICGGIAGIKCPINNQICTDDPRDSCDPNHGGADCSGICLSPQ